MDENKEESEQTPGEETIKETGTESNTGSDSTEKDLSTLTDVQGDHFNAGLHVCDPDGNPILTKVGNLRRKSGKKTTSQKAYKRIDTAGKETKKAPLKKIPKANIESAVQSTLLMEDTLLKAFLGKDAALTTQDCEKLAPVLEVCFKRYGTIDPPPWMMLLFINGAIIGEKMKTDSAKERITEVKVQAVKAGLAHKLKSLFKRKKKPNEKENKEETPAKIDTSRLQTAGETKA